MCVNGCVYIYIHIYVTVNPYIETMNTQINMKDRQPV